jgi:hypothetical protein
MHKTSPPSDDHLPTGHQIEPEDPSTPRALKWSGKIELADGKPKEIHTEGDTGRGDAAA